MALGTHRVGYVHRGFCEQLTPKFRIVPKGFECLMHCHPTTSDSSHLLEGVFLGVSKPNRNQKLHKFPVFSTWFRIRPRLLLRIRTPDAGSI